MSLSVKVVTPKKIVFEGSAEMVKVPGWLGEYGVLPKHASMLTLSRPGILSLNNGSESTKFAIDRGFVEVGPNDMSVMVQNCVPVDEINKEEVQAQLAQAEKELKDLNSMDPTYESIRKRVEFTRVLVDA
jgi:F-type H+-transporting ATPase subunit epsilon